MQAMIAGSSEQPRYGQTFLLLCYSGARLMLLDAHRRLVPLPYPLARSVNGRWIRALGVLLRYAQRPAAAQQLLAWLEHDPQWRWTLVPQVQFSHNPAMALPAREVALTWHTGSRQHRPALSWLLQGRLQHMAPGELYRRLAALQSTPECDAGAFSTDLAVSRLCSTRNALH